mmetsp:Transcript_112484/g.223540  ORF Transcript_112484/g.223540 Transcript_112484/m.223540 type:complete len:445 (-) Transcript_112484:53-1387(-)
MLATMLVGTLSSMAQAASGGSSTVNTLTRATFDSYLETGTQRQRSCLVMFHVDWCKVCQRTFPKFANASGAVNQAGITLDFAHVDCTEEKALCQRFEVRGYPTIKFFPWEKDKKPRNFKSLRTEEGFVKYARRMTAPLVQHFANADDFNRSLVNETMSAFVAAVPSGEVPAELLDAAEEWRDRHVFTTAKQFKDLLPPGLPTPTSNAWLAVLSWGRQQWSGVDNTSKAAPAVAYFSGPVGEVADWLTHHRFPGIWALEESTFWEFTHASRRTAICALDPARVTKDQEAGLRTTADKLKDDFLFGVLDGVALQEELIDFSIAKGTLPRVLVTEDNFEYWVEDVQLLRVDHLEKDLRALMGGAPLLRQSRGMMAKILYYQREVIRYGKQRFEYAKKGPAEAITAGTSLVAALCLVGTACWCLISCCRVLLNEDPDFIDPPGRMKRD